MKWNLSVPLQCYSNMDVQACCLFIAIWSVLWFKLIVFGTETSVFKPEKAYCDDILGRFLVLNMAAVVQQTEGAWDGASKQEDDSLQVVFHFLGFTMRLYTWIQSDTKLAVFHSKRGLKAYFYCQLFMCCFRVGNVMKATMTMIHSTHKLMLMTGRVFTQCFMKICLTLFTNFLHFFPPFSSSWKIHPLSQP